MQIMPRSVMKSADCRRAKTTDPAAVLPPGMAATNRPNDTDVLAVGRSLESYPPEPGISGAGMVEYPAGFEPATFRL